MRKEADDIGPRAELDHWKKRMSKFNYLLDQIKSHDVKTVLGILQTAKSKSIKVIPAGNANLTLKVCMKETKFCKHSSACAISDTAFITDMAGARQTNHRFRQ